MILENPTIHISPAEELFNKKMIEKLTALRIPLRPRWPMGSRGGFGTEWKVELDVESQRQEYPSSWIGIEQSYDPRERLVLLHFSKHFIGKDERGNPNRKTDKNQSMWIPEGLLRKFELSGGV